MSAARTPGLDGAIDTLERLLAANRAPVAPAEPTGDRGSSSSHAKRQRRRRALARRLDESLLGPDESTIVHRFDDGWTVRRVSRLADQHREGMLARNCLRWQATPLEGILSLRDPDGLPSITFCGWRRGRVWFEPALLGGLERDLVDVVVTGPDAVFVFHLLHPGTRRYLPRLHELARDCPDALPPMPPDPMGVLARMWEMARPHHPTAAPKPAYAELLRRVEEETALERTLWPGERPTPAPLVKLDLPVPGYIEAAGRSARRADESDLALPWRCAECSADCIGSSCGSCGFRREWLSAARGGSAP